jgi:glycosyltransferase involved in cell wall biosynthesis
MKVIFFTKYVRKGASSRLRSYQYLTYLNKADIHAEFSPLFSEKYLYKLYSNNSRKLEIFKGYINRLIKLSQISKYNKIVIEKELFPYLPPIFEKWLKRKNICYVVDYDDAIFHNYDQSANPLIRKILGRKIETVMKNANIVTVGNIYLAEYASNAGAKNIEIIPTVIDLERYQVKKHRNDNIVVFGWIGTKTTFEKHLLPYMHLIHNTIEKFNVEFHVVGIDRNNELNGKVKYISWSEDTEVQSILDFDVGIMPLTNSLWEKGKCAYKLIQYMGCGIPVIASDVGMNKEVVQNQINGFVVNSDAEWLKAFSLLASNYELRKKMGYNGRKLVEEKYCIQKTSGYLIKLLKDGSNCSI